MPKFTIYDIVPKSSQGHGFAPCLRRSLVSTLRLMFGYLRRGRGILTMPLHTKQRCRTSAAVRLREWVY